VSILAAPFERRSLENPNVPISAYQLSDIFGGGPTRAGVQVNEKTALTYMAVYTCVKVIAESLGTLPLKVYRRVDSDRSEVVNDRPESYMLGIEANEEQSAAVFKETLQAWQCLWGNGYARILKAGRSSVQAIPLRSDRVHPERQAGRLVYRLEGDGPGQTFDKDEIIHLPGLSMNGVSGLSPVGIAREAIATGKAQEIFTAAFYGNGTNIGGALTHPGKLKPEGRAGVLARWNAANQGVANAHRVAVLDEGVKFEAIGMRLVDAQFLESRNFQGLEICRLYRVPPHMAMNLERSTNNNIEQQAIEFVMYCLSPWLNKWEQEVSRKLFGAGSEYFVGFDLTKLLMADMPAQQAFFAAGRQWGYLSVNDVRKRLGLNPVEGGDIYLSPQNMVPTDKAHPLVDSQIAKNQMQPPAAAGSGDGEGDGEGRDVAAIANTIGILVRSGAITPQAADEPYLRKMLEMPEASKEVTEAWSEEGGVRRPITLVGKDGASPAGGVAPPADPAPEDKARKLAERLFTSAVRRMVRKEVNALRKAAEKPEGFGVVAAKFYGEHRGQLAEALAESAAAVVELVGGDAGDVVQAFAESSIEARRGAMLKMPVGSIEAGLRTHEEEYPGWAGRRLAEQLMEVLTKRKQ